MTAVRPIFPASSDEVRVPASPENYHKSLANFFPASPPGWPNGALHWKYAENIVRRNRFRSISLRPYYCSLFPSQIGNKQHA